MLTRDSWNGKEVEMDINMLYCMGRTTTDEDGVIEVLQKQVEQVSCTQIRLIEVLLENGLLNNAEVFKIIEPSRYELIEQ